MKIFVTGATGLIGSHFVRLALEKGHFIYALRRTLDSQPRISWKKYPNWITKSMDELGSNDFKSIDVFVHLAAHSMTPPYESYANCLYWNLYAPLNACCQAVNSGIKNFLIAGSCFEYGKTGEEVDFIPTEAVLKPTNTYAASKALSSTAFEQFSSLNKVSVTYLRIFHVYGEGESETRLWPSLKKAALSGIDFPMTKGEQVRDFIEVSEVAKCLLKEAEHLVNSKKRDSLFVVKNLGSGKPQSILEFSQFWWNKWQAKGKLLIGALPYREGEVMRYVPKI
jgi:nucleoside-diphosphate-sugar epimerase